MLRSLVIQVIVFTIIFNALSWYKEGDMLPTNTLISVQSNNLSTLMDTTVKLHSSDAKTVIYFFAPWCKVCHLSIENLQDFYLKNEDVNVVAVALDFNDLEEVNVFVKQHKLTFPIVLGNENIKQQYSISGYPSYYVVDELNTVLGKSLGYSTELGMTLRTL